MIHIDFNDVEHEFEGKKTHHFALNISGHAQSGRQGEDLVCCSVSTLGRALMATLDEYEIAYEEEHDEVAGYLDLKVDVENEDIPAVYIMFMECVIGLMMVAEDYPEYVSIHRKEI